MFELNDDTEHNEWAKPEYPRFVKVLKTPQEFIDYVLNLPTVPFESPDPLSEYIWVKRVQD